MSSSSPAARRRTASESFGNAAEGIGPIVRGMSHFAITRGQWSMIDAILHCLDGVGPAKLSIWTWSVADYEVEVLTRLRMDKRLTAGLLICDHSQGTKAGRKGIDAPEHQNTATIRDWRATFGPLSCRVARNHAKIATLESESGFRLLLRGSMNLNFNPRFEQFDVTEGGPDFDLVKQVESELPLAEGPCTHRQAMEASKLHKAFTWQQLSMFSDIKVWAK